MNKKPTNEIPSHSHPQDYRHTRILERAPFFKIHSRQASAKHLMLSLHRLFGKNFTNWTKKRSFRERHFQAGVLRPERETLPTPSDHVL